MMKETTPTITLDKLRTAIVGQYEEPPEEAAITTPLVESIVQGLSESEVTKREAPEGLSASDAM
jgi:hypothetical protein